MTEPAAPGAPALRLQLAAVAAGAALGGAGRDLVTGALAAVAPGPFPWGTLAVNLAGALALAAFASGPDARGSPLRRPFFAAGVCGSFTTFAALEREALGLAPAPALAYLAGTVAAGLLLVALALRALDHPAPWAARARLASLALPAGAIAGSLAAAALQGADLTRLGASGLAAAGGAPLGAVVRHALARALPAPWGTLAANLLGCGLLGWIAAARAAGPAGGLLEAFVVAGALGGLTTFSTFCLDATALARRGAPARAGLYVVASVLGGLGAHALGARLG